MLHIGFTSLPVVMEAATMSTLLTTFGEVVTAVLGTVADIVSAITSNPLLLLGTGLFFLGACVRVVGSLTR